MGIRHWLFEKITQYWSQETKESKRSYLSDFDRICHEVIPGDVLLIEGTNRISNYIKSFTHSPWTHAALYIGRIHSIVDPTMQELVRKHYFGSAGDQLLVDSLVGQGTFIKPISTYRDYHIRICRPTGISQQDAQQVINFVVKRVGHPYDMRHFIDLARFLLKGRWFIPRCWRSTLFSASNKQTSKDICSGMIADAFTNINFPILPLIRQDEGKHVEFIARNPKLYTPADFDYSPYFSIIKYPILPLSRHAAYHDFPWRNDLLSNDENIVDRSEKSH